MTAGESALPFFYCGVGSSSSSLTEYDSRLPYSLPECQDPARKVVLQLLDRKGCML